MDEYHVGFAAVVGATLFVVALVVGAVQNADHASDNKARTERARVVACTKALRADIAQCVRPTSTSTYR